MNKRLLILFKFEPLRLISSPTPPLLPNPGWLKRLVTKGQVGMLQNFNPIFWNWTEKYRFDQKLYMTKFIDLIEMNDFAFLRFFRISHITVKRLNFPIFNSILKS